MLALLESPSLKAKTKILDKAVFENFFKGGFLLILLAQNVIIII
jgi:hypothetical protein